MERSAAIAVPDQTFIDALAGQTAVRLLGLDGGNLWSVYAGPRLVGVVTDARWLRLVEQHAGITRFPGASADEQGDPPDQINAASAAYVARLEIHKGRLEQRVSDIDARIVALP